MSLIYGGSLFAAAVLFFLWARRTYRSATGTWVANQGISTVISVVITGMFGFAVAFTVGGLAHWGEVVAAMRADAPLWIGVAVVFAGLVWWLTRGPRQGVARRHGAAA